MTCRGRPGRRRVGGAAPGPCGLLIRRQRCLRCAVEREAPTHAVCGTSANEGARAAVGPTHVVAGNVDALVIGRLRCRRQADGPIWPTRRRRSEPLTFVAFD